MLSLTLSGGGFRATLFHLGTISFLRSTGQLADVKRIYSVSGGSVLAAHLVLNWHKYTGDPSMFEEAALEVIDFTRADIRGQVVRAWILSWLLVLSLCCAPPSLVALFFPSWWPWTAIGGLLWLSAGLGLAIWFMRSWSRIKWLERAYGRLLKNARLRNLADHAGPELHLLCTDLTVGDLAAFSSDGFRHVRWEHGVRHVLIHQNRNLPVALGVAASSAYPVLFPPVRVDNVALGMRKSDFPFARYLTDGGIYENLGVRAWHLLNSGAGPPMDLLVSDAQREIDTSVGEPFFTLSARASRASDIMMRRVSELENEDLPPPPDCRAVRLHDEVILKPAPDSGVQWLVQNVRTDLNTFSPAEIQLLVYQGYAAAFQACVEGPNLSIYGVQLLGDMPFSLPKDGIWLPYQPNDRKVNPDAAKAVEKSNRLRVMDLPPAPLWYLNAVLTVLFLGLLYPSLMGWAWLYKSFTEQPPATPAPSQPSIALSATWTGDEEEFKELLKDSSFLRDILLSYGVKDDPTFKPILARVGPFNPSPENPIVPFRYEKTLLDGYELKGACAFLRSKTDDQCSYTPLKPDLEKNKLRCDVPASEGAGTLLLILSVKRPAALDWPPRADDLFQRPKELP